MERLKFQFEVVPAEDQKSNVIAITSITNEKEIKFQIPSNLWPIKHHAELTALPEFKKVITTLKKRGHTRNVWFNLSEQVLSKYKDESGNMAIGDYLLEESQTSQKQQITAQTTKIDENLLRILEKFSEHKEDNQTLKNRNLSKISEKFVIEKFNEDNCRDWHSSMLIRNTLNSEWKIWRENFLGTFADKGWSPDYRRL
ncbi:uncharacterized protein LOC143215622 isoform X2 [Lasioglossum baleicum]|uniref:uncharacterized protein LOC143215622 isoform X2 n=1 Tax=Lasioglossum baleicum TaxID=434251 RepID=UPI003FCEE282